MTERAWDAVRAAAQQLVRQDRDHNGSGRSGYLSAEDLRPLLVALGLPTHDGPPARPDTWITVKGSYAWWVHPAGETDPAKADVWLAPLEENGEPDYANALKVEDVENWEGFPWEGREPTMSELRELKEHVIGGLGFLGAGAPRTDALTEAADRIGKHIAAVMANIGQYFSGPGLARDYEHGIRGGLGGVQGDFAASFNLDVAGHLVGLLTAIATHAPIEAIRDAADRVANAYNDARSRDDNKS